MAALIVMTLDTNRRCDGYALDVLFAWHSRVLVAEMCSTIIVIYIDHSAKPELSAGAYTNLVKLQMQQEKQEVTAEAEIEEVVASGGKPISKASFERVESRYAAGVKPTGRCSCHHHR